MKIETRLDTGEYAFVICKEARKVVSKKILDMRIKVIGADLSGPSVHIEYSLDYSITHCPPRRTVEYSEEECFRTKQELLDSL